MKYFGTGNANDVIYGILQNYPNYKSIYGEDIDGFKNLLSNAHGYLLKIEDEEVYPEVLRIDLFRKIEESKEKGEYDFVGGLFHSFKHFSIYQKSLSTGKENAELVHTARILSFAKKAFFNNTRTEIKKGFKSKIKFDDKYDLHFYFYKNQTTNTSFINTIIKKSSGFKL